MFLGLLLTFLIVPLLAPFLSKFLRKIGAKQLSQSEYSEISTKKYPSYYKLFDLFIALVLIAVPFGLMFLEFIYGPKFQQYLFGNNALLFVTGIGLYAIVLVSLIGSILFVGSILSSFVWLLSTPSFKQYLLYKQGAAGYKLQMTSALSSLEKVGIVFFIILIPFAYLAIRDYQAVYPDRVVLNSFTTFTDRVYTIDQIQKISSSASMTSSTDKYGTVSYSTKLSVIFFLKNGEEVDVGNNIVDLVNPNFYSVLKSRGVTIGVKTPDQNVIDREYSCYDENAKSQFSTIFQLNNPKFTKISCSN